MEEDYELQETIAEEQGKNCIMSYEESGKKHITMLRSFEGIDFDVKIWVENKILSVSRRIHKYDKASLVAYIIRGYESLGKNYDIDDILETTKSRSIKRSVLDLISGGSTKNSPINDVDVIMPILIVYPTKYIELILEKFFLNREIEIDDRSFNKLCENIKYFTHIICEASKILPNYEPRSLACSFVYFYLVNCTCVNDLLSFSGKKFLIKKSHFKSLSFYGGKKVDINPKDFDICYLKIERYYKAFQEIATEEELYQLIYYSR